MKQIHILILLVLVAVAAGVTSAHAAVSEFCGLEAEQTLISNDNSGAVCVSGVTETCADELLGEYLARLTDARAVQFDSALTVVTGTFAGHHLQIALRTQGDTTRVTAGTPYITTGY